MAPIWRGGGELLPVAAGVEFAAIVTTAPAHETTTKRSGAGAWRIFNSSAVEGMRVAHTTVQGEYFFRFYFYTIALPTSTAVMGGARTTGVSKVTIRMTTAGALQLWNTEDGVIVGSASSNVSLNTWYRCEVRYNSTTLASTSVEAKLYAASAEGTLLWNPSGTMDITANPTNFGVYNGGADATFDVIYDDCGINDTTGTVNNSWLGEGEVIVLRPNGNGDNSQWTGSDGNSTDNYLLVNETTIDTATYVQSNTNNQIDDYAVEATPAAMASNDVINCVLVGVYAAVSDATSADPDMVIRAKASTGGTVEESATLDVNSITWNAPSPLPSENYKLAMNDLPGASTTLWTKADLDAMQIGIRESATDTHFVRVSAIWVMVDHKPAGTSPTTIILDVANVSANGRATDVIPGAITKLLDVAALIANGRLIDVNIITTILLDTSALISNGRQITINEGAVIKLLDTSSIIANGRLLDVAPGSISKLLDAATLISSGITLSISKGVVSKLLDTALLFSNGRVIDIQPGVMNKLLDTASLNSAGVTIVFDGINTIIIDTALVSTNGRLIDTTPGMVNKSLDTAILNISGIDISVSVGTRVILLDNAIVIANGRQISVFVVSGILLDTALINSVSSDIDILPGAYTIPIDTSNLFAAGIDVSIVLGVRYIPLDTSLLQSIGNAIIILIDGSNVIYLDTASLNSISYDVSLILGDVIIPLSTSTLLSNSPDIILNIIAAIIRTLTLSTRSFDLNIANRNNSFTIDDRNNILTIREDE